MTVSLLDLWLPILISSVIVFFASFLAWMVLPHHRGDWKKLPDEDAFLSSSKSIPPGSYMFPCYESPEDAKTPEFQQKMSGGPNGTIIVWSSPPNMGANLGLTFAFYVVVGVFVGYVGATTLAPGTEHLKVFQVIGTTAVLAYCFGHIPDAIWFRKHPVALLAALADGVVYALLTAGVFAWLWPAAG